MNSSFSVFVNSCDSFSDCWPPFFLLFKKNWPTFAAPLFLNTETKKWATNSLDIISTQVQSDSTKRLTWSECLIRGLDQVKTPLVLYLQEDYFIDSVVKDNVVRDAVNYMIANPEVKYINLSRHGSLGPYINYAEDWLQVIDQRAKYRICTQAGLWRVNTLKSYLLPKENAWMFEIFGTWRAWKRRECFLSVKCGKPEPGPVIDYLHTGIIKGKWLMAIQPVFEVNGIEVDYQRRGFYQPGNILVSKLHLIRKLLENPIYLFKQIFGIF